MPERTFWILSTIDNGGGVVAIPPAGAPPKWRFFKGLPLAGEFPSGAWVRFSKDFPKLRKLHDFVANPLSLLIASRRVRDLLAGPGVRNCEFLPVTVRDHKDKVVGNEYFIVHPLGGEDGIDLERSVCELNSFDSNAIDTVRELRLRPEFVSPDAHLFRFKQLMREYVVDGVAARALQAGGVTGCRLIPAEGWNGSDLDLV